MGFNSVVCFFCFCGELLYFVVFVIGCRPFVFVVDVVVGSLVYFECLFMQCFVVFLI